MIAEENSYDYYPEKITTIILEHNLIQPEQQTDFIRYLRGL